MEYAVYKCIASNNKNSQSEFQNSLAEVNALMGDFENAYKNFRGYQEIKDSIFSQTNKNKIAAIESRAEIDKKNLEIEKQKIQVNDQKKNIFLLLGGLLIMAFIVFLFYRLSAIRKEKNNELTVLNQELEDANKVKAKFFGILSHDLRSPIANLISFLRLQKTQPDLLSLEQSQEQEQKITHSAETLLKTMEAMLLWSKGQMQNFKPEIKPIEVESLFNEIQNFYSTIPNIHFTFFNPFQIILESDENYLRTIMQNLTSNAIQVLKRKGDGVILWKASHENGKTILSITDNGPGVSKEQLKALYHETSISGIKNGLGLHIIRDLAKSIGCQISHDNAVGGGTVFNLIF